MEISDIQKAAICAAMEKAVKAEGKKAREKADDALAMLYGATGADRMKVELNGEQIGTLTLQFTKDGYEVVDSDAFERFMLDNGLARVERTIKPEYMSQAVKLLEEVEPDGIAERVVVSKDADALIECSGASCGFADTGEVVPGILPRPSEISGSRLTGCKPEAVVQALRGLPGALDQLLLGGAQ